MAYLTVTKIREIFVKDGKLPTQRTVYNWCYAYPERRIIIDGVEYVPEKFIDGWRFKVVKVVS